MLTPASLLQRDHKRRRSLLFAGLAAIILPLGAPAPTATIAEAGEGSPRGSEIRPHPEDARSARGRLPGDGCFLPSGETRSPRCIYGVRSSDKRVVLFGDSHAMHYYPALGRIAREREWRLVVLTKAGCPPMLSVKAGSRGEPTECSAWRRSALRRIESRERPDMVIAGASVNYRIFGKDGEAQEESARQSSLRSSYRRVLSRLRRSGARTVVMKDVPRAPFDVPSCVAEHLDQPGRCAFDLPAGHLREFDARAAESTGSKLISVTGSICRDRRCRAVIRKRLVYRAGSHLTAPFARTLRLPLDRRLPQVR